MYQMLQTGQWLRHYYGPLLSRHTSALRQGQPYSRPAFVQIEFPKSSAMLQELDTHLDFCWTDSA